MNTIPDNAGSTFLALFLRSYSRRNATGARENWDEAIFRCIMGLDRLGNYTQEQLELIMKYAKSLKVLPSGRWMWVGGTKWVDQPENYIGAYNCSSVNLDSPEMFGLMMNMAMQGTGTGCVIEPKQVKKLPPVRHLLDIKVVGVFGFAMEPHDETRFTIHKDGKITIVVGDSRIGWVSAYQSIIDVAMAPLEVGLPGKTYITVDISAVRPKGRALKGFGGVSNPESLPALFPRMQEILNGAANRDGQLTPVECCLLVDEAAKVVVAGSIRRSAGMRQGGSHDEEFAVAKDNLWQQIGDAWVIDPKRDALRMANHTRVFHKTPTLEEVKASVNKQFKSGEGAIQYAPEALARSNADLINTERKYYNFLTKYEQDPMLATGYLRELAPYEPERLRNHRMGRYGMNPCFAPDTMVLTHAGHAKIADLVGMTVEVWDGDAWTTVDNFRMTGENQSVSKLTLSNGDDILATPTHRFFLETGEERLLQDLQPGDKLLTMEASPKVSMEVVRIEHNYAVTDVYCCTVLTTSRFTLSSGLIVGNCGEILGEDFLCNLSEIHLKTLDPWDLDEQIQAFSVGGWITAALLKHNFENERQQYSRNVDPIVGVSFTGLFDFFAKAFGLPWLQWWAEGRTQGFDIEDLALKNVTTYKAPQEWVSEFLQDKETYTIAQFFTFMEQKFLGMWKRAATNAVYEYCLEHNLKLPNRCTTVQPAGSKSLLTDSSPGWHPPKGAHYIRRITYRRGEPLALALRDAGFNVVPGQSDKDDEGKLLTDPMDPRCTEWLVEMPVQTSAGTIAGAENIDFNAFSATAQLDFYMQVQNYYTTHNTSATIELAEHEIDQFCVALHKEIGRGFMSAALLPRYDSPFPRLPFEVISREQFFDEIEAMKDRATISHEDFYTRLAEYDDPSFQLDGPAQCDSAFCLN